MEEQTKGAIGEGIIGTEVYVVACDIRRADGTIKLGTISEVFLGRQTAREHVKRNFKFIDTRGDNHVSVITNEEADRFITAKRIR